MDTQTAHSSILPSLPGASFVSSLFSFDTVLTPQEEDHSATHPEPSTSLSPSMSGWLKRPAMLKSSLRTSSSPERPASPTKSVEFNTGDFAERASEDGSREGSFISSTTEAQKRKRRSQRPKTSYSICHPPRRTGSKHKIKIRARPLLQLHKLELESRPKPALEVLPTALFSPTLSKAIAKVFGAKHGLSPTDLAVVAAEEYHKHKDSDEVESRDVLALICGAGRKDSSNAGKVKISLADGSEWEAYQTSNGSYECCTTDAHGLKQTVRWVQKKTQQRDSASVLDTESILAETKKFNFSTIASNSRRHPVIANLTSTSLDISDSYTLPTPVSTLSVNNSLDESATTSNAITTTDQLRQIITATAVWVAVREGWCPSYRADDSLCRSSSLKSVATLPGSPGKASVTNDLARAETDGSVRRSSSFRQTFTRGPSLLRRQAKADERPMSSQSSVSMPAFGVQGTTALRSVESLPVRRRARADTTSTVVMYGTGSEQWRPDYDDNMHEVDGEDDLSDKDSAVGEGEHDGENARFEHDDEVDQLPRMNGAIDAAEKRRRRVESHARPDLEKRNVSEGTSSGSSFGMLEKEKMAAPRMQRKKGVKGGFFRKLFCGMF